MLVGHSPYELLFSAKSNYSNLKPFGCLSYVCTSKFNMDKLSPCATPCVFLGYPYGIKAYKFLSLDNDSVIISRDAIFHESIFPYVNKSSYNFVPLLVLDTPESYSSSQYHLQPDTPFLNNESPNASDNSITDSPSLTHSQPEIVNSPPHIRRSTRTSKVSTYLTDYVHPYTDNHTADCHNAS